ncbi:MAG: tetratricopeptide repeat protein, partial [Psychroserpens sp.]|nr:tetratricopeptide repeat protein [Psychroserpens sp.]
MKVKSALVLFGLAIVAMACSSSVEYSEAFKKETAGKYLFNSDDVMEINYDNNDLYLTWRGVKTKPVATDENEFFVPDLYKKLRFVQHPQTNERYLSVIPENNPDSIGYDYIKVPNDYRTPSQLIKAKEFDKALEGLLAIKAKDSMSEFINQYKFNRIGYRYLRDENYEDAIGIFTMNTKLHPSSGNVYDSLGDAYARSGD